MADAITAWVTSIDNEMLSQFDLLINNQIIYLAIIFGLLLIGETRNSKRMKVALAILISLIIAGIVNLGMAVERPCAGIDGVICPMFYSFPSIHCAMAFILMIAFLEKKQYPFYVFFALLVAFSRIHLGVHMFRDVAGALIVGLLAYNITYLVWKRWKHE